MKTKTVFRTFRDNGEIIALFPEIPATLSGQQCESYMHTGQHGAACPHLSEVTRPANAAEIAPLRAELERIGYEIEPRLKVTRAMDEIRRAAATLTA